MHHFFWLLIVLAVVVLAFFSFVLGHRTAEWKYEELRKNLVGAHNSLVLRLYGELHESHVHYEGRIHDLNIALGKLALSESAAITRAKALFDDLSARANDNEALVKYCEDHWKPEQAERHRGKAAACREILALHGS